MKKLIYLSALVFTLNLWAFPNMQKEIDKKKYSILIKCNVVEFNHVPFYDTPKTYPYLKGQPLYILNSNNWSITKLAIGDLKNPFWVSKRLNDRSGAYNNDKDNFSFSYSSIGSNYHALVYVDKKSGNGFYNMKYDSPMRYLTGEGLFTSNQIKFDGCVSVK